MSQQYCTQGEHTTRPIGRLGPRADAHEVYKAERDQLRTAEQASIESEKTRLEEQRSLELGLRMSLGFLDFPPLPPPSRSIGTTEPAELEIATATEGGDGDDANSDASSDFPSRKRRLLLRSGRSMWG